MPWYRTTDLKTLELTLPNPEVQQRYGNDHVVRNSLTESAESD